MLKRLYLAEILLGLRHFEELEDLHYSCGSKPHHDYAKVFLKNLNTVE